MHRDEVKVLSVIDRTHRDGANGPSPPVPVSCPHRIYTQAGTITVHQLFGQPCVNVRVSNQIRHFPASQRGIAQK